MNGPEEERRRENPPVSLKLPSPSRQREAQQPEARVAVQEAASTRNDSAGPRVQLPSKLPPVPDQPYQQQEPITHEETITVRAGRAPSFLKTSPEYEGPVELWKLVYGRLTTNQFVFYHREHPELPYYSISDIPGLSTEQLRRAGNSQRAVRRFELANRSQTEKFGRELIEERFRELEKKIDDPTAPRDAWERRIEDAFRTLPGNLADNLKDARGRTLLTRKPHIRAQSGVANWVEDALHRAERWIPQMAEVLDRNGLPPQLLAIPLIEGLFQERAVSKAKAVGPWQFLSATAKINGLMVNSSIDERRDPLLATAAAARYFDSSRKTILSACGSIGVQPTEEQLWPIVVTSYNRGAAGMARVIRATKSCDLAEMVRKENDPKFDVAVKSYWPAFLAAVDIFAQPDHYFARPAISRPPETGRIFRADASLRKSALEQNLREAGMTYNEFLSLNPAVAPNARAIPKNARVRLPANFADQIADGLPLSETVVR